MLFRTVVLLTSRVNLLIKGVAPAVWPVIVIVVSSAWVGAGEMGEDHEDGADDD